MATNENEKKVILSNPAEISLDETTPMLSIENYELGENPFLTLLEKATGLPGVKINRTIFLMDAYKLSGTEVESENVFSQISLEQMDKVASSMIAKNVTAASCVAFALGLSGGFAMAGTIPADILQNFAFSLRLAQQLAYVYGFDDLFVNDEMNEQTRNTLIAFLGIMFAVTGSSAVLRAITPNIGKHLAKQALSKPLTKTVWYPMLKKITSVVASKTITKKSVSGFATKAVPVVGGVVSGGITVATMIPMANRLKSELRKYYLSEEEILELEAKEEKEKIDFGGKASNVVSDVAVGAVKIGQSTKNIGKGIDGFAKQVSDKIKTKLNGATDTDDVGDV